ncbi:3-hydroxyacyl-CoA dehydrogenase NAD-binding domain-containing protein [Glutamicibacter mysorens]
MNLRSPGCCGCGQCQSGTSSPTLGTSMVSEASGLVGCVCNMHFFNPVLATKDEAGCRGSTSDATVHAVVSLASRMGKEPVPVKPEIPEFIFNGLLGSGVGYRPELPYSRTMAQLRALHGEIPEKVRLN